MEFKGTKGKWKIIKRNEPYHNGLDIENVCMLYQLPDDNESEDIYNANALLISKAPTMLRELQHTIDDLKILKSNILDASKTNYRWDGMADIIQSWIDRKEQLIKQATEI